MFGMSNHRPLLLALAVTCGAVAAAPPAHAANAECTFREDWNGETEVYPCDFEQIDRRGSFNATGNGSMIQMNIGAPGRANANMTSRGPTFDLGAFRREAEDRACWLNERSGARVCAY